ncbi:helix-turn-helix domain-containing protein [Spirosoma pulveris]
MSSNIRVRRICEQCGNEFEARTTVTKTCSDSCAKRAYKARQRAAKVTVSNEQTRRIIEKPLDDIRAKENLNIADASKLLGVSRWTIWRAIGSGNLHAVKLGRRTLIRRSDVDRLFEPPTFTEKPTPAPVALVDCYTMKEIQEKYGISEKALYTLIQRNNIPKQYKGPYAYVPKVSIDELLTATQL